MQKAKQTLRWILAIAVYYSGLWSWIRRRKESSAQGRRNIILRYHRVNDNANQDPFHLTVSPGMFEKQLEFIKKHYQVASVEEILEKRSQHPSAGTEAAITFDDGYLDNYAEAFPILKKQSIPAAVFVTTNLINTTQRFWWDRVEAIIESATRHSAILNWKEESGESRNQILDITNSQGKQNAIQVIEEICNRITDPEKEKLIGSLASQLGEGAKKRGQLPRETMTWEEVQDLRCKGITIGSHGLSHKLLTKISHAEAAREIVESKQKIEAELQHPVRFIAYPGGKTSDRIWQLAKKAGYQASFSTENGENDHATNPFCLKRRAVHENVSKNPFGGFSEALFALSVEGFFERKSSPGTTSILYVIDKMTRAGSQKHLVQLLRYMDREVFNIKVVCMERGGPLTEELDRLNIPYEIIGIPNWNSLQGIKGLGKLFSIIRKFRPEIVHAYLFTANAFSPLIAKLARVRTVITSRRDLGDWKTPRQIAMNRLANRFTDVILVNSDAVAEATSEIEEIPRDKFCKIYNGMEFQEIAEQSRGKILNQFHLPSDKMFLGTLGNIREEKDPMTLMRSFVRISQKHPEVDLLFGGRVKDEKLFEKIQGYLKEQGVADRVHFLGSVEKVSDYLSLLEVFVFTSQSEGFSNSMLEAMSAALPIIATRLGGNKEQIVEGVSGFLFAKGNDEQCATLILKLLDSPELRTKLGQEAMTRRKKLFNVDQMVSAMITLYRSQLQTKNHVVVQTFKERESYHQKVSYENHEIAKNPAFT